LDLSEFNAIELWNCVDFISSRRKSDIKVGEMEEILLKIYAFIQMRLTEISAKGLVSLAQAYSRVWSDKTEKLMDIMKQVSSEYLLRPDKTKLGISLMCQSLVNSAILDSNLSDIFLRLIDLFNQSR
jgi:hypothetical protein